MPGTEVQPSLPVLVGISRFEGDDIDLRFGEDDIEILSGLEPVTGCKRSGNSDGDDVAIDAIQEVNGVGVDDVDVIGGTIRQVGYGLARDIAGVMVDHRLILHVAVGRGEGDRRGVGADGGYGIEREGLAFGLVLGQEDEIRGGAGEIDLVAGFGLGQARGQLQSRLAGDDGVVPAAVGQAVDTRRPFPVGHEIPGRQAVGLGERDGFAEIVHALRRKFRALGQGEGIEGDHRAAVGGGEGMVEARGVV